MPGGMWKLVFKTMFSRKIWFSKSAWKVWGIWAFLSLWLLSSMSRWLLHFEHMLPRLLIWAGGYCGFDGCGHSRIYIAVCLLPEAYLE